MKSLAGPTSLSKASIADTGMYPTHVLPDPSLFLKVTANYLFVLTGDQFCTHFPSVL